MEIDTRWCGCRFGGYYPVRFEIKNAGQAREIAVRLSNRDPKDSSQSIVERKVRVEEGATRKFTLSVPLFDGAIGGPLQVLVDGAPVPQLSTTVALPPPPDVPEYIPEMLVIAKSRPELSVYGTVVEHLSLFLAARMHIRGRVGIDMHAEVVEPNSLPEGWVDYSGLDLVAVSLETWQGRDFSEPAREAILKWVANGGTLIIHGVGESAQSSRELSNRLQLENRTAMSPTWIPADPSLRDRQTMKWSYLRNQISTSTSATGKSPTSIRNSFLEQIWSKPSAVPVFEHRDLLLGRVIAMSGDPFPGSLEDWDWLLYEIGSNRAQWTTRHGVNHRRTSERFGEFTIPGVGEAPVRMFLVLITVFTLVIGPLNFFILNRRKQLYLLLVTVPVLAALTSVSLFVYAMLSDGLNVKARLRSLTLLDQKNHEAVSVSRGGFYAGLAPTAGLKFSPETLVLPIWPGVETPAPSDIDWSNGQHFASSWLRSRTPTQFVFRSNRIERGRLEISTIPGRSEELQVANGFSWDIAEIVVCDQSKTLFFGQDLRAGATTVLHAASAAELTKFGNKISAPLSINSSSASNAWNRPEETRRSATRPSLGPFGHPVEAAIATNYSDSQAERFLKSLREGFQAPEEKRNFPQHFYVATCLQPPALDFGLPSVTEISSLHVLYGRY